MDRKDIKGYEGLYQVNNKGEIFNVKKGFMLKQTVKKDGHCIVTLSKDKRHKTFLVQRLIAKTFMPTDDKNLVVYHKDRNKKNNSLENLEWITKSEKTKRMYKEGFRELEKVYMYDKKGNLLKVFRNAIEASEIMNIPRGMIIKVCNYQQKSTRGYVFKYESRINEKWNLRRK